MQPRMLSRANNFEVIRMIILFVTVFMMNVLISVQQAAKYLFHNGTMFPLPSSAWNIDANIPIGSSMTTTLPLRGKAADAVFSLASMRTKLQTKHLTASQFSRCAFEGCIAVGARSCRSALLGSLRARTRAVILGANLRLVSLEWLGAVIAVNRDMLGWHWKPYFQCRAGGVHSTARHRCVSHHHTTSAQAGGAR